ncbi:MAG: PEP-CTERM sorting domain-containing protein [Rhodanobacter sp.]
MSTKKEGFIKSGMMAAAMLAMFAFGSSASASVVRIHFSGAVGSGYANLTLGDTDPADVVDPSKTPLSITDASGMFNGTTITGVRAINNAPPPPGEVLPASYSLFSIPGYGDNGGVSYNNLFYPDGSPMICLVDGTPTYPFSGGFLDLMGVMFALDNGSFVDLWSFGVTPPGFAGPSWQGGLLYGISVIQPTDNGYEVLAGSPFASASVPEPNLLWLFGAGVLGLFAWLRWAELRKESSRIG